MRTMTTTCACGCGRRVEYQIGDRDVQTIPPRIYLAAHCGRLFFALTRRAETQPTEHDLPLEDTP